MIKNALLLGFASLAIASPVYSSPFMTLGDGAELFLTGNVGMRADDNIFLAKQTESDFIFDVAPGLDLRFGKNSLLQGSLALVHTFTNYADNSKLDTNLLGADFASRYENGKTKVAFNTSFNELNQNSVDIRGLTRRDVFAAGVNGEVSVTQVTSLAAGVAFNREDYKRKSFTDSDSLTLPLDFFYKVSQKLDLSVGYRYRDYQVDLGESSSDQYFNVGGRGEFTPKLSGRFTVGYGVRDLERSGSKNLLGMNASLQYELSPKTNLQFGAANDFGTSPQGVQQKNLSANALITTKISAVWSLNGGFSWRNIAYARSGATPSSTADYSEAQVGASYTVNSKLRISGGFVRRDNRSNLASSEFKNNVFNVSASFRF